LRIFSQLRNKDRQSTLSFYSARFVLALVPFPCLQPLSHLVVIHQVISRQPVRFSNEHDAQSSADSGFVGAPAKFAQSEATVPMRCAEMPGYERKLFLDFSYDWVAKPAG
jgi:hypothetical protein